jgi:acyl CoA:acetate/3-ketoacid CoA transferase alpha subunit/acyl CoA:acetate/3-ketoacid CoA transferase beta subunit
MSQDTYTVTQRWKALHSSNLPPDRQMFLAEAIRTYVKPGASLYLGGAMARPNAAMFEIARQFWDRNPDFTLIAPAVANQHAPLLQQGLFRKVVSTIHANTFPTPAPHRLYGSLEREGAIEFEDWSLLTLVQRLMAGAFGLPSFPTRSLIGSDLGEALRETGLVSIDPDPFTGEPLTLVRALNPDVTIVHGLMADSAGNVLIPPPHYDGKWAALAATKAVIATVERIVEPAELRRHAGFVQLPAERVSAVCEVPFGGHPNACPSMTDVSTFGYVDDYDFLHRLRDVGSDSATLAEWAQEWILDVQTHEGYLQKLGRDRLHCLRGKTADDGWLFDLPALSDGNADAPISDRERQLVLTMRALKRTLSNGQSDCILAGLGISSLAAWMAAIDLHENGTCIPLMVEAGMYGYIPSPADPFLFNYRNMLENSMLWDVVGILGVMTGGNANKAIGVLGAAQVDQNGNINTSRIGEKMLTGSGGGNDIASAASAVMVTIPHSSRRLVEKVDFITSPGRAVQTIVTEKAILQRCGSEYELTHVMAEGDLDPDALILIAKEKCGWTLKVSQRVELEPTPSAEEVELARLLDPERLFLS